MMNLQSDRQLLMRMLPVVILLIALSLLHLLGSQEIGMSTLFVTVAAVAAFGFCTGLYIFISRYPAPKENSVNHLWIIGCLLGGFLLCCELYYLACNAIFHLNGAIEKFGQLGDSFGPLTSTLTLATLVFSIVTAREQAAEIKLQQGQISRQTEAWTKQVEYQKAQADALNENNILYKQMILAQRMATAANLRQRIGQLYIEEQRQRQTIKDNGLITGATQLTIGIASSRFSKTCKAERESLQKLLNFEIGLIGKYRKELGITDEDIESYISPKNVDDTPSGSDPNLS